MVRRDLPLAARRLIRVDGSVVIPAGVAGEVLRRLLRDLDREVRADGGRPSPAVYSLMWALHGAAEADGEKGYALVRTPGGSAAGTPVVGGASVEISTAEAARLMGCSESYVRRLARLGLVPARRVAGVWLITRAVDAATDESEAA